MMLADLYAYLTTSPGSPVTMDPTRAAALVALQALIGTRMYPDFLKERATMPALVYQLIDQNHGYILQGDPINIEHPRVQIDVYSNDPTERETLGGYIKVALDGYMGTMGSTSVGILMYDNESNEYVSDSLQYRKMLDFKVIHYS
jgi:hypothetical protein